MDLEGAPGRALPHFCCNHLFFCGHFEELQTAFIENKLIINKAPLTYVYLNTIKTYLRLAIVTGVLPSRDSDTKRSDSENKSPMQSSNVPEINSYQLNIRIMTLNKQIRQGNKS